MPPPSTNFETSSKNNAYESYEPKTLHSIYFRGSPPTEQEVLERLSNKVANDVQNMGKGQGIGTKGAPLNGFQTQSKNDFDGSKPQGAY